MTNTLDFARKALRGGTALQALALLGAGVAATTMFAAPAAAQDYNQVQATGKVQGTNGEAIAGANVTVTSNDQGFTRTVTTDSSGAFRVAALPQGSYTFTIDAPGFDTFTDSGVTLTQAAAANQFTLAPTGSSANSDIVVTAGRVQVVDFDRNNTGVVINVGELARRVPVARDITSVVLLSPGTTEGDTAFGNSGNGLLASINGASVSENLYYLNGLDITQIRNGLGAVQVPFEFYQTIDIKNGGISAEFGRTTGGVINATTKSGSNQFHGSVGFTWNPDDLRSKRPDTYATDYDSAYSESKEFVAQLSGPIIKDHLFFYGLYNSRDIQSGGGFTGTASNLDPRINPATGAPRTQTATQLAGSCFINPTLCQSFGNLASSNLAIAGTQYIKDRNTSPFYGGKLDAVIIDGQRLEATYFNSSALQLRNTFGTSIYSLASGQRYNPNTNSPGGYASSTVFRSGGENYVFRYTGTFTNWLTLSAAYGRNYNRDTTESNRPDFPSVLDQRNGANTGIGNTTPNSSFNFDKRTFYRADADLNFNILGSHHVRGGYDREDLNEDSNTTANGGFQYTLLTAGGSAATNNIDPVTGLTTGSPYVTARTFVTGGSFTTRNEAYYIQDSWQLFDNRLQLNLGLRDDRFENKNAAGQTFYKSGNNFSPRVGFSLDPLGNGRTKIYGSFSRYFLPVALNTNVRLAGGELDYDAYYNLVGLNADSTPILGTALVNPGSLVTCPTGKPSTASCVVRKNGTVKATAAAVASNLQAQSTDEFILGGEQRFGSRIKLGAFFTYTKLNNSLEDSSIDRPAAALCLAAINPITKVSNGSTPANATACNETFPGGNQEPLINPGEDVSITLFPFPDETTGRAVTIPGSQLGYPHAKRTYRAMSFTFEREFDGVWSLNGSYTYSKLVGNIEGGVRSDNGQTDSGLTTAFDEPALTNGAYGYLPNDRRHNFKIYGSYKIGDFLTLGANAQVSSPRHYACFGRAPANADFSANHPTGQAGPDYQGSAFYCNVDSSGNVISKSITSAPGAFPVVNYAVVNPSYPSTAASSLQVIRRGTAFKSDWLYNLNLDVGFKIPSDAFDAELRLSVFNVFNHQSKLDFQENGTVASGAPNPVYGLPTYYQSPRAARVQFTVGF